MRVFGATRRSNQTGDAFSSWVAAAITLAIAVLSAADAGAETPPPSSQDDLAAERFGASRQFVYTGVVANDALGDGEDRWYTSGLTGRLLLPSHMTPFLSDSRLGRALGDGPKRLELSLGQQIFTPEALSQTGPVVDDRPYGGFFYIGAGAVVLRPDATVLGREALIEDQFTVQLGAIGGEASLGETVQELAHGSYFNGASPNGWANGLESEPGVNLVVNRAARFFDEIDLSDGLSLEMEFRPTAEVALGNVLTQASVGAEMRFGDDLHYDLGRREPRPGVSGGGFYDAPDNFSWSVFGGVMGRAVAHNVFLDGNVFRDGPDPAIDIDPERLVFESYAGVGVAAGRYRLGYTLVWRTREFEQQDQRQAFGVVSLSARF